MFKVKKVYTTGQCWAMRCTGADDGADQLCLRHQAEWEESGRPDLSPKVNSSFPVPDTSEAVELSSHMSDFEITDQDEYNSIVEILHDTINKREEADTARGAAGRVHYEPWKAINEAFKPALGAYDGLIETIKGRIVAMRESFEAFQDYNISVGETPEALLEEPPGLSIKPEIVVTVLDMDKVPERYLKVVLDSDAIIADVGADYKLQIDGLAISSKYKVSYRRPNAEPKS